MTVFRRRVLLVAILAALVGGAPAAGGLGCSAGAKGSTAAPGAAPGLNGEPAQGVETADAGWGAATPGEVVRPGKSVTKGDVTLTVDEVVVSPGWRTVKPPKGYKFVFVRVGLENRGIARERYSEWEFSIEDSDGTARGVDALAMGALQLAARPTLRADVMAPGTTVSGYVGFVVTEVTGRLVLEWEPGVYGVKKGTGTVKIELAPRE